jgi:pimeloyl-ACP methyl ester carboxylesterase
MKTFVLIPGAWMGAWVWEPVTHGLRDRGHLVRPVTLPGIADGADAADVGLATHVEHVLALLEAEDLRNAVVVGHLYSGIVAASESDAEQQLGELVARAGAEPSSAWLTHASHRDTKRLLAGPDWEGPFLSKSEFFRGPLPAEAVATLLAELSAGCARGQSRRLDFAPMGGAYNRVRPGATAFVHRAERFLLQHAVELRAGASSPAARRWLARSWACVHPWSSGGVYANFPDPEITQPEAYFGANARRLLAVRAA